MNYIIDEELVYKDQVRQTLIQYNLPFTGIRPTDTYNIYVLSDGVLVGFLFSEMGWDYVSFPSYYFTDQSVLDVMMEKIHYHYKNKASGIKLPLSKERDYNAFILAGFKEAGKLSYNPDGADKYILRYGFEGVKSTPHSYMVYTAKDPIDEYECEVSKHTKMQPEKEEVVIAAFNNDTFVGGVYGYLQYGYLYIHLLAVEELYRGQDIGTELMNRIEEYAVLHDVHVSYVATCTFQAYEFYLKCGYTHDVTIPDKPKGYDEYIFSKKI